MILISQMALPNDIYQLASGKFVEFKYLVYITLPCMWHNTSTIRGKSMQQHPNKTTTNIHTYTVCMCQHANNSMHIVCNQ